MPTAPLRFCPGSPTCPHKVPAGTYCPEHQRAVKAEHTRYSKGNYGRPWRRRRQAFIDSDPTHLWCAECLTHGKKVVVDEVDHIIPHRGDVALRDDHANLQSLCRSCHAAKTSSETLHRGVV